MALIIGLLILLLAALPAHAATKTGWVNIKDPAFGALGDNSHDDTAAIQAAIDYASANSLSTIYCPAGNYKTTAPLYLDPPGNLRSSLTNPTMFGFSLTFFGDPSGGALPSCRLRPTFNNDVALYVGPGQGMRVSDVEVLGPAGTYRGNQDPNGVGIGLTGGNGGSSVNLIENTTVNNFYALYKTDANGGCCLNDSNTFRKVHGDNGYFGIYFNGTQADINDVIEPRFSTTIGVDSEFSRTVTVIGGNISAVSGVNASFGLSSVSGFTKNADGDYRFTGTIASPDAYVGKVYNSYMIHTAHFGVVPVVMLSFDSGTHIGSFGTYIPWAIGNYGGLDLTAGTDIQAEVAAATTIYAAERVAVVQGLGVTIEGVHVENGLGCTSLYIAKSVWAGATFAKIKNPYFNYDPSLVGAATALLYCQQTFPFIGQESGAATAQIILEGGDYGSTEPIILEMGPRSNIKGSQLGGLRLNERVYDTYAYGPTLTYGQYPTSQNGTGTWDNDYFVSDNWLNGGDPSYLSQTNGYLTSPFCGFEPCQWALPNLPPSLYSLVSSTLGALGTYAPVACRTVFKSVDWNSGAITHPFLRSASCPGFSYGQDLTDALVGETLTWSYKGQSDVLYLSAKTLKWMFPGLGISIDNGGGAELYIVTGVYQPLGYITVDYAGAGYPSSGPLVGTKTTVYSCASSCSIGQASYSWTAY